ncbi:MAG: hypothetical protein ACR2N6_06475 [Miltoncostaeaceae bacterium]
MPRLDDYVAGASAYVRRSIVLDDGPKKAAQIRLSGALSLALKAELEERLPGMSHAHAGERDVGGALRVARADLSEMHPLDGLRLGVELKPVHLAVGRNLWNRFGDIRTFAVNLHLKFPFAVVGGVLTVPSYEWVKRGGRAERKSTIGLIERAVDRLSRAGGRRNEGDAPHLLEAAAVVVFDPDADRLLDDTPPPASGLRWDEFVESMAGAYDARFGDL